MNPQKKRILLKDFGYIKEGTVFCEIGHNDNWYPEKSMNIAQNILIKGDDLIPRSKECLA